MAAGREVVDFIREQATIAAQNDPRNENLYNRLAPAVERAFERGQWSFLNTQTGSQEEPAGIWRNMIDHVEAGYDAVWQLYPYAVGFFIGGRCRVEVSANGEVSLLDRRSETYATGI